MTELRIEGYSIIGDRMVQQDAFNYIQKKMPLISVAGNENGEENATTSVMQDVVLAVVCDGMGGMEGGEFASRKAIETIFRMFENNPPLAESDIPDWFQTVCRMADQNVCSLTGRDGESLMAGTTVVAVMIIENRLYWVSVGDSRIYFMDGNELHTITRMHNYFMKIEEMLRDGSMTVEESETEKARGEALISYLGIGELPIIDTNRTPIMLRPGQAIILCSDGLYKSLDDSQVRALLDESGESPKLASMRLCNTAYRLATGKQDNTTTIVIGNYETEE